jgi:hypothetical protein
MEMESRITGSQIMSAGDLSQFVLAFAAFSKAFGPPAELPQQEVTGS